MGEAVKGKWGRRESLGNGVRNSASIHFDAGGGRRIFPTPSPNWTDGADE